MPRWWWEQWGGEESYEGRLVGWACSGSLTWWLSYLQDDIFHPCPSCVTVALPYLLVLPSSLGYISHHYLLHHYLSLHPHQSCFTLDGWTSGKGAGPLGVSVQPGISLWSRSPRVCIKYTFPHGPTLARCHSLQSPSPPPLEAIWPAGMSPGPQAPPLSLKLGVPQGCPMGGSGRAPTEGLYFCLLFSECNVFRPPGTPSLLQAWPGADAVASSPLRLWSSNTAASKPAAAREGGAWAADTDPEARAGMWRFRPGPCTAPQYTRVPWGSWVGLPTGE